MSSAPHTVAINRRAADRIRSGHTWIYRSDLTSQTDQLPTAAGALVTVADSRGIPLGSGLYSSASEIAVRLVSRSPGLTRPHYLEDLRTRLTHAIRLRHQLAPEAFAADGATSACRLVFSEADDLPGIVLDRYAGLVVAQLLIQGTAQHDVRQVLAEVIAAQPWASTLVDRPDPRIRELEQLDPPPAEPLWSRSKDTPELKTIFTLNSLRLHYDASAGQKTGAFLDQRLNYAAAAHWAHATGTTRRALDVCTYQGGFALHLAQVCDRVTGVDASRAALEVAEQNRQLNEPSLRATGPAVNWIEADAFDLLRDWQQAGERFDTIVLDPPAFAKSKRAAESALRGYKELNLRAMKMLGHPGTVPAATQAAGSAGTLVTCSCSHHVSLNDFIEILRSAAIDANRRVQILDIRGAAPDHPAILTLPETSYLKCILCRVS